MPRPSFLVSIAVLTAATVAIPVTATATPVGTAAQAAVPTPALSPKAINRMSVQELRELTPRVRYAVQRSRVDPAHGYEGQRSCRRRPMPGTVALKNLLKATYLNRTTIGLNRGCGGDTSEHYDGRALDWMVNARNPRQAAMGDAFVNWLTKKREGARGAMARRLGVMYVIWRGRMWRSYDPGWRDYNGCSNGGGDDTSCHRDHVHISLNWAGARKKTSWYRAR